MAKLSIKGIDGLLNKLIRAEKEKWRVVFRIINKYVDLMVADAKANAPVDRGVARESIGKRNEPDKVVFLVASAHGAIQEFGFGTKMGDIPPELREEALKFKGYKSGDFKAFVEELEEWCERKGLDPKAAYVIAGSILDNGIPAQPFFFPAFQKYKQDMLDEIQTALNKLYGT